MSSKQQFYDFIQDTLGNITDNVIGDLKIVFNGKIYFKVEKDGIELGLTDKSFIAIVDKSRGKDIFKKRIPISGKLQFPTRGKAPIKYIAEFKNGKK